MAKYKVGQIEKVRRKVKNIQRKNLKSLEITLFRAVTLCPAQTLPKHYTAEQWEGRLGSTWGGK